MQQYPYLSQCPKCLKHNPRIKKSCYFCSNSLEPNSATASTHSLPSSSFTPIQAQQSAPVNVNKAMPMAQMLLRAQEKPCAERGPLRFWQSFGGAYLSNCLGRIQMLRTYVHAIHDGMATE